MKNGLIKYIFLFSSIPILLGASLTTASIDKKTEKNTDSKDKPKWSELNNIEKKVHRIKLKKQNKSIETKLKIQKAKKHFLEGNYREAIENDISITIWSLEQLEALAAELNAIQGHINVHLKIDTGGGMMMTNGFRAGSIRGAKYPRSIQKLYHSCSTLAGS